MTAKYQAAQDGEAVNVPTFLVGLTAFAIIGIPAALGYRLWVNVKKYGWRDFLGGLMIYALGALLVVGFITFIWALGWLVERVLR